MRANARSHPQTTELRLVVDQKRNFVFLPFCQKSERENLFWPEICASLHLASQYRGEKNGLQILLSHSQAVPGRNTKQGQEEISCNHVITFFLGSVSGQQKQPLSAKMPKLKLF